MIKSGALDQFGESGLLLGNLENILTFNKEATKNKSNGQTSLFADAPLANLSHDVQLKPQPPAARQEKLAWEKELLGLYVTEHPFADYKKFMAPYITPIRELGNVSNEEQINIAGVITKVQKIITRTSKSMLFVKIEDDTDSIEVLVFPNLLAETASAWIDGKAVFCQGRMSDKDQERKILANNVVGLDLNNIGKIVQSLISGNVTSTNGLAAPTPDLKIIFYKNFNETGLAKLKEVFTKYPGSAQVFLEIAVNGDTKIVKTDFRVKSNSILITELLNKFAGSIRVENMTTK